MCDCMQDLSLPFRSSADVQWHKPQALGTRQETSIVVQVTHLKLVPAFAHVPLVHAAMRIMQASTAGQKEVQPFMVLGLFWQAV